MGEEGEEKILIGGIPFKPESTHKDDYFRIDNWYEEIKHWTFATTFIPLSLEAARTLARYKEMLDTALRNHDWEKSRLRGRCQWDNNTFKEIEPQVRKNLTDKQRDLLLQMIVNLDAAIKPFVERGGAAFVKLSSRSPKDAAFFSTAVRELIKKEIEKSTVVPGTPDCDAEDVVIFTRCTSKCLAVRTGEEAVLLLTRSERIHSDIIIADLDAQGGDFAFSMVVREWDDSILPEWEFRVFVFNNKITAATQYNHICYVPEMVAKKKEIKKCIISFWESVKGNITEKNYTIDLALRPDLQNTKIVELNNPAPIAGTSLFNWFLEGDRKLVENGSDVESDGFELRINNSLPTNIKDEIYQPLRRYIDFLRGVAPLEPVVKHTDLSCDQCHVAPITKTWYECEECERYDLCVDCKGNSQHNPAHKFVQKGEVLQQEQPQPSTWWCSVV